MDWLFSDPTMPHSLRVLVYVAIAFAAITYIVKSLKGFATDKTTQAFLKAISHEVHNNNGSSLKDKAQQALAEARKAREVSESTDHKVDWLCSHLVGRVPSPEEIARHMQSAHNRNQ